MDSRNTISGSNGRILNGRFLPKYINSWCREQAGKRWEIFGSRCKGGDGREKVVDSYHEMVWRREQVDSRRSQGDVSTWRGKDGQEKELGSQQGDGRQKEVGSQWGDGREMEVHGQVQIVEGSTWTGVDGREKEEHGQGRCQGERSGVDGKEERVDGQGQMVRRRQQTDRGRRKQMNSQRWQEEEKRWIHREGREKKEDDMGRWQGEERR